MGRSTSESIPVLELRGPVLDMQWEANGPSQVFPGFLNLMSFLLQLLVSITVAVVRLCACQLNPGFTTLKFMCHILFCIGPAPSLPSFFFPTSEILGSDTIKLVIFMLRLCYF